MKSPSKDKTPMKNRGERDEAEMENYTHMMINNQKFRDELVNNPLITYLVKSNILSTDKKEPLSPKSDKLDGSSKFNKNLSGEGHHKWNTEQKVQLHVENKEDGSPSQRTIYIKNAHHSNGYSQRGKSTAVSRDNVKVQSQKEVDRNKEY
jgi:hypothetical protein